jgi:hypothetical protein
MYDDPNRKRKTVSMDRSACGGYLDATSDSQDMRILVIRLHHLEQHTPYCDIQLPPDICREIDTRTGETPAAIWADILRKDPNTPLSEKQVYARWMLANQGSWRLHDD